MLQTNINHVKASELPVEVYPELMSMFQNFMNGKLQEKMNNKTLADFATEYLALVKSNHSLKYYQSVQSSMKHLINFLNPEIRLNDINARDIDLFIVELKRKAPRGYLVYFRTLKSAFSKAMVWGYTGKNPFKEIRPGKLQKHKITVIKGGDLKIILSKISNRVIKAIVETSYYSGCRLSEVLNLRVRNLDVQEKMIRIGDECFTTKSRKERYIPIPDKLLDILKPFTYGQREGGFLFPKPNGFPFSADYISKSFKTAIRKAKLSEDLHFHSLRHSYASNLAASGASPYCLRDLLGHSSVSVTEIYAHTNLDDLRKTVNLLINTPLKIN